MGMTSMFSGFTNFDTTFDPNNFQSSFPHKENCLIQSVNINKPYEILSADNSLLGYFWYFGNSVDLVFEIDGEITLLDTDTYIDIKDILKELDITATIYDFRMEPILIFSNNDLADNHLSVDYNKQLVTLQINKTNSLKLVKGKYFIELQAEHPSGYNETLFSTNTCTFEVR